MNLLQNRRILLIKRLPLDETSRHPGFGATCSEPKRIVFLHDINKYGMVNAGVKVTRPDPKPFRALMEPAYQKIKLYTGEENVLKFLKMVEDERSDKCVTLRVTHRDDRIKIAMIDDGIGISTENLTRIFSHGFTTKKDGHSFGLHSGALAAKGIGGSLTVHSDGPGQGAAFTLELPFEPESRAKLIAS